MKRFKYLKRLLNRYRTTNSELFSTREIVEEMHGYFSEMIEEYCEKKDIDLQELKKEEEIRLAALSDSSSDSIRGVEEKIKENEYDSKSLFRQIAKKFHPDMLDEDDPERKEKEEVFKTASSAIEECNWGILFDIAEKYDLQFKDYDSIISSLKLDIERVNALLEKEQNKWSWLLFLCDESENCKDNIAKGFLKQVYSVEIT